MRALDRWSIGLAVTLVVLVGCSEGPEDSVRSLGKAFRNQDRLKVTRYMDVDRTAASVSSAFMTEVTRPSHRDSSGSASALGEMMGTAMIGAMQPAITAFVRQMIYYLADSAASAPTFMAETTGVSQARRRELRDSLANLGVQVRRGRTEGDVALVPVFFPATRSEDDSGTVELRLERAGKNWRVVGVEHLPEAIFAPIRKKVQ